MIWENFINFIRRKISKPDKKEWLDKLIENLETQQLESAILPFKILQIKSTGFLVKVAGLYAFISFSHMPWKYNKISDWTSIFPTLIDKYFLCTIHSIKKEPQLSIIVDGEVPQLKKTELQIGKSYKGIIMEKLKYGIIIDIGYHFHWKCGSFVGLLHRTQFEDKQLFSSCSIGDEIEIIYQWKNEKGQISFTQISEMIDWDNGIPQRLVGEIVLVQVVRETNEKEAIFLVNGKYNGKLVSENNEPYFGSRREARKNRQNLKDGDVIHCEVIGILSKTYTLELKWITELDSEIIEKNNVNEESILEKEFTAEDGSNDHKPKKNEKSNFRNNIFNNLDDATIKKMLAIRDEI